MAAELTSLRNDLNKPMSGGKSNRKSFKEVVKKFGKALGVAMPALATGVATRHATAIAAGAVGLVAGPGVLGTEGAAHAAALVVDGAMLAGALAFAAKEALAEENPQGK